MRQGTFDGLENKYYEVQPSRRCVDMIIHYPAPLVTVEREDMHLQGYNV
jgi:hypothetical protein